LVKRLDENSGDLIDHIGWRLWQASRGWHKEFVDAMREAGHEWFTDARATLLAHIAPHGTPQSRIIERMGISKQAVQQLIDGLEAEDILQRLPDPNDRRGRIVRHTEKGQAALRDADAIKRRIEVGYCKQLGKERFEALRNALVALNDIAPKGNGGKTSG
jgi:DNA-binding MarR family transcriptional regulator